MDTIYIHVRIIYFISIEYTVYFNSARPEKDLTILV